MCWAVHNNCWCEKYNEFKVGYYGFNLFDN